MKLAVAALLGALAGPSSGSTIDASSGAGPGQDTSNTALTRTFERIFAAEAGHWRGRCVAQGAGGTEEFEADFTITWDADAGHRFEGRYGDLSIRGQSRIAGSERIDVIDGEAPANHALIESAAYRAADDYRYVLREDGEVARRSTITRLGALQVNMVEAIGADPLPLRVCTYRLSTPRRAATPGLPVDWNAPSH